MKQATLCRRVYGSYRTRLLGLLKQEIVSMVSDLDCKIVSIDTDRRDHVVVSVEGEDEEFTYNLIAKEYGVGPELHDVRTGIDYLGQIVDPSKVGYGFYVDIAIPFRNRKDVLIPLHRVRVQTGMHEMSLRGIAKLLVLAENLPVHTRVVSADLREPKLEGEFSPASLTRLQEWGTDEHERLLVFGANQQMIENALTSSGHQNDIIRIEQLGYYEFSLLCKRSTRASGIIAAIGPKLRGIPMHLFIPSEVNVSGIAKT